MLADYERALFAAAPATRDGADEAPLRLYATVVAPEWIDYNGHAHESRYLQVFGDTTDALLRHIGVDLDAGSSYFTVESHLSHLGQARAGDRLHTTTQVLGHDAKRLHVFHSLYRSDDDALIATAEQMLLHVDTATDRASAADPALLERIERDRPRARRPAPARAGGAGDRDPAVGPRRRTPRRPSARLEPELARHRRPRPGRRPRRGHPRRGGRRRRGGARGRAPARAREAPCRRRRRRRRHGPGARRADHGRRRPAAAHARPPLRRPPRRTRPRRTLRGRRRSSPGGRAA